MDAKSAAFGIYMHSGWGVLVAVCMVSGSVEVVERRRITVIDPRMPGASQPYHHARLLQTRSLDAAQQHITKCASISEQLSVAAIEEVRGVLRDCGYRVAGAAVLQSAGRPLPSLPKILASHPMIHTAEGEFFCRTVRDACERLQIPVVAIRKRDLEAEANNVLGKAATRIQRTIAGLGKSIGPPWTADHKAAALAAATILARG